MTCPPHLSLSPALLFDGFQQSARTLPNTVVTPQTQSSCICRLSYEVREELPALFGHALAVSEHARTINNLWLPTKGGVFYRLTSLAPTRRCVSALTVARLSSSRTITYYTARRATAWARTSHNRWFLHPKVCFLDWCSQTDGRGRHSTRERQTHFG